MVVVDCTLGGGGHFQEILKRLDGEGLLIGIDADRETVARVRLKLNHSYSNFRLIHANFRDLDGVLGNLKIESIDAAVMDLGLSSLQLDDPKRGFSIRGDGPLDMRIDSDTDITASKIINRWRKDELTNLFREYGDQRFAARIAKSIVERRKKRKITATRDLAEIVRRALPARLGYGRRIHPATKVFMALRMAVNEEPESLKEGLEKAIRALASGGRLCVISFQSSEDRIVKNLYRRFAKDGLASIITKKPVVPSWGEIKENPRSRSAKMRVCQRM